MTWKTFDEKQVSTQNLGKSVLVKDSTMNDFIVYINREQCGSLSCVEYIELHDNIGKHTAIIRSDGTVSLNSSLLYPLHFNLNTEHVIFIRL